MIESPQRDSVKQAEDVNVLKQAQEAIREETLAMKEDAQSAEAEQIIDSAVAEMDEAITALDAWSQQKDMAMLDNAKQALEHETAAYDWLLKLRGRDVEVVQAQGQGGGASQSDPQLADMNLKKKEERYQEENRAQQEAMQQQRAEKPRSAGVS